MLSTQEFANLKNSLVSLEKYNACRKTRRNNRQFDKEKIRNAVYKAGGTMTDADAAIMLVQYNQIRDGSAMKIARIQELVEESLMKTNPAVAVHTSNIATIAILPVSRKVNCSKISPAW
ncbi:anaerobic ribonucleotide reductase subunit [Klebsiella phage CPRSA]|nr:anaerobic ribonucleotide reductase subunit [Klebsiella phage CPRSA]